MKLPPALTLDRAAETLGTLRASAAGGQGTLAIDASGLADFDTTALALLLQARRLAQSTGRPFEVNGAPPKLAQLAQLYGVAGLLGLAPAGEARYGDPA
jgi:phospholipid transport system transporter-binding protein